MTPLTPSRPLRLWLPVAIWAALIFGASSSSNLPDLPAHVTDKTVHAAIYAVLAGLCLRALAGGCWAGVTMRVAVVSLLLATAYGATDELHQLFVTGRTADLLDLRADLTGSAAAALLAVSGAWLRRRGLARMENLADGHSPGR